MFAIGGWSTETGIGVSFKCNPEVFRILKDEPGMRPAPYLASRGMSWLQWVSPETVSVVDLEEHLWQSYSLVAAGLTKAKRRELGMEGSK